MAPFNFTIHYRPGVKMGHTDFALRINTFLPKDSTSASTSNLRDQKQLIILPSKQKTTTITQSFNLTNNKKQKLNPMAPP